MSLDSSGVGDIKMIGVGKDQYSSSLGGMIEGRILPWVEDSNTESYPVWSDFDASQREVFIINYSGNIETSFDITPYDPTDPDDVNSLTNLFLSYRVDPDPYTGPIWYIAELGSDETGNGSQSNPFATIQKGINTANSGDTILVSNGHYFENINWPTTSNIRLIGSNIDSTIVDGGNSGKVIDNSDETSHPIEISNLTIQNGNSSGKGGGISLKMVGVLLMKNIRIQNNHAQIGGGVYIEGQGSTSFIQTMVHFDHAIVSDNSADTYGGGVSLSGDLISSIMKNSTIVNNSALEGGGGIKAGSMGDYAIIVNSIFWNNQPSNAEGMVFPYYSNIDIPIGSNNIYANPLFINTDDNFNLMEDSPCIDAGTDFLVVDLSSYMLPGNPVDTIVNISDQSYNGIAPDMGAIESEYSLLNLCTADDNTEGVELWGECYSIENTTELLLQLSSSVTGEIPQEIGYLTNLTKIELGQNQLTGFIPPEIGNLTNLSDLYLMANQLTGSIPPEIGNLTNLSKLDIRENQLTGSIPPEIGNLTNLSHLKLNDNQLTGAIPSEIMNIQSLTYLNLKNNELSGEVPISICSLPIDWSDNHNFNINNNQLCPPYPSCILEYVGQQDTSNCASILLLEKNTIPIVYALHQNYPNPFNPVTSLRYELPEDGLVNITIYDMMGRIVKTLVNSSQTAGFKSVQWNATNDRNEPVSAGLYLYTIQAGIYAETKKMVLLK